MAASVATMAMLNAKCLSIGSTKMTNPTKPNPKPISLLSMQNLPKGLTLSKPNLPSSSLTGTAIVGAIFSTLSSCDPAFAAQEIAEIAEGDNRMRSTTGVIIGLGLGGLAASGGFVWAPEASASEIAMVADAASSDNRGTLLLFVVAPALLWVAYNILQPALNQLNRTRSQ